MVCDFKITRVHKLYQWLQPKTGASLKMQSSFPAEKFFHADVLSFECAPQKSGQGKQGETGSQASAEILSASDPMAEPCNLDGAKDPGPKTQRVGREVFSRDPSYEAFGDR